MDKLDEKRTENLEKVRQLAREVAQGKNLTYEFEVDYTSDIDGEHYTGTVMVHRPAAMEIVRMGALKAQYIKQQFQPDEVIPPIEYIDTTIKIVAQEIASLTVVVDKCPAWLLEPAKMTDIGLLSYVYRRYFEWVENFRSPSSSGTDSGSSEATK